VPVAYGYPAPAATDVVRLQQALFDLIYQEPA
jgi:hypothetical protein